MPGDSRKVETDLLACIGVWTHNSVSNLPGEQMQTDLSFFFLFSYEFSSIPILDINQFKIFK